MKSAVKEMVERLEAPTEARFLPAFKKANVAFPPAKLTLIGLKKERRLEVWAERQGHPVLVKVYPVLAASGVPGPKLMEGDLQVPEGLYRLTTLNPKSNFYLSMRLNYPNVEDLERAAEDGRENPGGDIYIHGKQESTGCLAVGDTAIEELFVMTAKTGHETVQVIVAPNDLRVARPVTDLSKSPAWTGRLYEVIRTELERFR